MSNTPYTKGDLESFHAWRDAYAAQSPANARAVRVLLEPVITSDDLAKFEAHEAEIEKLCGDLYAGPRTPGVELPLEACEANLALEDIIPSILSDGRLDLETEYFLTSSEIETVINCVESEITRLNAEDNAKAARELDAIAEGFDHGHTHAGLLRIRDVLASHANDSAVEKFLQIAQKGLDWATTHAPAWCNA